MSVLGPVGYAFNRTRKTYLATQLSVAGTYWSRLRGLMCSSAVNFGTGQGLWIVPSRGVHTLAMRFPIDVVYLNGDKVVVYMKENLKPWRVAPVQMRTTSVLELPGDSLRSTHTQVGDEIEIAVGRAPEVNRQ
jgi:uncharacterized membrane protein (UPF0127 family)